MSMADSPASLSPRKHYWGRFTLWAMLALTLLCIVLCVCLAVKTWYVMKRREAVKAIEKVGGEVIYSYEVDEKSGLPFEKPTPPGPAWLRWLTGDDFFAHVTAVTLGQSGLADGGTAMYLKMRLDLRNASSVHDSNLLPLQKFPQLRWLQLSNTKITDAGLATIESLGQLELLWIDGTEVSDTGLEHLGGLAQLRSLSLDDTKITDAGLEHIRGLLRLRTLILDDTAVTDAGLQRLRGLTQLNELYVQNTHVTDNGIRELRLALPHCKVFKEPGLNERRTLDQSDLSR